MGLLELFITAVALSMDAFAVSMCKGLATQKVQIKHMALAGLWFGGFQALMPLIGYLLGSTFESYITAYDHWIAFVLLGFLGADSQPLQMAATIGAAVQHGNRITAIVAHQPFIGRMIGQPGAAALTFRRLPTIHANHTAAVATAVQKQNRLPLGGMGGHDGFPQINAEAGVIAFFQLLAHIHQAHLRQLTAVISVL